jgi:hypothetical protein
VKEEARKGRSFGFWLGKSYGFLVFDLSKESNPKSTPCILKIMVISIVVCGLSGKEAGNNFSLTIHAPVIRFMLS